MNFLAHYVIATRFMTPAPPLPSYVVGTALPDLLPLAARHARLRPVQAGRQAAGTDFEAALSAGVSVHLATDAAFHKARAFAGAQAAVGDALRQAAFDGIRVRRFFVAHVLTELVLDAVLLRSDPPLADGFYGAFAAADFAAVTRWAEAVTGSPLPEMPAVLSRFARSEYLRQYATDAGVAEGLSRLCGRARQDTFDGANFARLVAVVGHAAARLADDVPALLAETAAGVSRAKQESPPAAANADAIMANGTTPEKKYRIHFPLNRISAPVVTHLVRDYDLSPNLLRADVDAKNGGWLVVGLTGDAPRVEAALDWMRGQGLDVSEEV